MSATAPSLTRGEVRRWDWTSESGAWTLGIESAEYGLVCSIQVVAVRKCGRVERIGVTHWPAGWRIMQRDLDIPEGLRRDAMRLAQNAGRQWWGW